MVEALKQTNKQNKRLWERDWIPGSVVSGVENELNEINSLTLRQEKKMVILWLMSDGTGNYVNKEYGYAKLFWDFQSLMYPCVI